VEKKVQRVTIDLPEELHRKLKILSAGGKKSMRDLLVEAITMLLQSANHKKEIKHLRHKLHRLRLDMCTENNCGIK